MSAVYSKRFPAGDPNEGWWLVRTSEHGIELLERIPQSVVFDPEWVDKRIAALSVGSSGGPDDASSIDRDTLDDGEQDSVPFDTPVPCEHCRGTGFRVR